MHFGKSLYKNGYEFVNCVRRHLQNAEGAMRKIVRDNIKLLCYGEY